MNKDEARALINTRMAELEALPFGQLLQFQSPSTEIVEGPSGASYQLEVSAFWESKKRRIFHIMVAIDDGGWRAFSPMSVWFSAAQKDDPVQCPVFLIEGRDVDIRGTVEEAEWSLEPWMIDEDIVGYDSYGRRLSLDTDGKLTFISLAELEPSAAKELERILRDFLSFLGEGEATRATCDLPCLVAIAGRHVYQKPSLREMVRNVFGRRQDG